MPYLFLVWCLLAVVVLTLAIYRKMVAKRNDDFVHLGEGDGGLVSRQKNVADRLGWIDQWGKILTVVTLVFGIAIGSFFLYQGWIESAQKIHV